MVHGGFVRSNHNFGSPYFILYGTKFNIDHLATIMVKVKLFIRLNLSKGANNFTSITEYFSLHALDPFLGFEECPTNA